MRPFLPSFLAGVLGRTRLTSWWLWSCQCGPGSTWGHSYSSVHPQCGQRPTSPALLSPRLLSWEGGQCIASRPDPSGLLRWQPEIRGEPV